MKTVAEVIGVSRSNLDSSINELFSACRRSADTGC